LRIISGFIEPDDNEIKSRFSDVSFKPQKITPSFEGTVENLINKKLGKMINDKFFMQSIFSAIDVESIRHKKISNLSGGEIQKIAILLCLTKKAQVYIMDEPSAYLDVEQRISISRVIKNFSKHYNKPIIVVEHDFMVANYLADRFIVFTGTPGKKCVASTPKSVTVGLNQFLEGLGITFRIDPNSSRPRINKENSIKDDEQKKKGQHIF
jgi:ATP-binding cassette subfamily E protein 1